MWWQRAAILVFCYSFIVGIRCKNSIRIEANGYSGILVAISPTIDRIDGGDEFLLKLKNVFRKASERLFNITRRRAYFREIIFLIPNSWDAKSYWLPDGETSTMANEEKYKDAVIYVEKNGAFGKEPYTIQTSGCGKNGLRMHLPEEFLKFGNLEEQANKLVFEWSKYRYGIFNEHGFANDKRYPLFYGTPGDSKVRVTSCLNQEVELKNDSCVPKVDYNTGKLESNCQIEIEPITDRISSFMYSPQLGEFCGMNENHHDSRSPTKQNVLCKEKSIWDVILQHEDFKDGGNSPSVIEGITRSTTFKFVQLRGIPLRIVFAIDRSKDVTEERGNIMNNAVTRFLRFIPQNSLVGTVLFGGFSDNHFQKELRPVKDIYELEERSSSKELPCIKCALLESAKLLEKESNSNGGLIYLLTTSEINDDEVANLLDVVINKKITVHIMKLYFNNYTIPKGQLEIISKTGGSIQEISENPDIILEEKIIELYLALCRTIRDDIFESGDNKIMIFQDIIRKYPININFPVDSSIDKELTLLYSTSNPLKMDEDTIELTTGDILYKIEDFGSAFLKKAREIIIPTAKTGEYRFSLKNKPDYSDPVFISVFAKANSLLKALTVRCWLNTDNEMVDPSVSPVIIYAEVSVGNQPVINAKVKAILTYPDSSKTSFFLIDDGIGDPDITEGDGIYSRYIAEFKTTGCYSLTLLVQDEENTKYILGSDGRCCGSFVPAKSQTPTGAFRRIYDYGNFYVLNIPQNNIYPPSRILDLAVTNINPQFDGFNFSDWRIYFDFRFTSVGQDYNIGSASSYEMKYFLYREEVGDFQNRGFSLNDWEYHPTLGKLEYGTPQKLKIEISLLKLMSQHQPEIRIYFAMQAADEYGNYGEVSNIVEVLLQIPDPPTPPAITSTEEAGGDQIKDKERKDFVSNAGVGLSTLQIGMIVGIAVGVLVIVVIIILVLFIKRRKSKPRKSERKFEKKDIIRKPSVEYVDDVTKSNPNLALNNLSPIQSWPANVLMDHYDKVRDAKQKNMTTPIMKVEDILESSSMSSSKSLKSNQIYENGDGYMRGFPTAPLSSSTSSLSQNPRHITQV